ncbi:protein kinase domain-containing protein [Loktanella sp. S4079]|uniref:protein kinase domain-containing protein n=1 Tax=Loktanella sp. S4079 TaxID=579483 RepID=UPI0005FA0011|nr:protein kinase [Loktanella sp. S4079]KJZ19156.1 serine/threonine protein kinase [Loktanella sp. S4079]
MAEAQVKENADDKDSFVDELKPGTKLMHGQYTIESFLNAGGFGITYLAKDSLDRKIVIKECFPGAFCRRSRYVVQARSRAHQNELKSIVRLFVQEARSLAKLNHPNIVGVHQVFEDNETAYMALDFVEGRDLLDTIEDPSNNLTPAQIKKILKEVLGAVGFIHDQGILHRDISPDNILINQDYHPVLIDFGAAREEATKQSRVLSALRVVKDGYSPQEFYIAGSEQSPSSDLYALAASFYHLIENDVPPNSQARLAAIASGDADPYEKLEGRYPDFDDAFLAAIDKALAVLPKDRLQSAKEWIEAMEGNTSNVTPLNVTSTAAPAAAAAAPAEKKSKLPLLLGSVAVLGLLGGGAYFATSGGGDVAETPAPAQEATSEAEAPTTTVTEAPAEPAPVAEPVATEQETATEVETATETETAPEAPAPIVVEEPTIAPVIVEDTPVEAPVLEETPTLRPSTRPESVEQAAIPEPEPTPEPLPEPVATPQTNVTDPEVDTAFPDQSGNRPVTDTETADVALPATPDTVDTIGTGLEVAIDAVVPGNEIVPTSVATAWKVELPFSASDESSDEIAEVALISPVWVKPGLEITSVNGVEVDAISEISSAVSTFIDPQNAPSNIDVTFGTRDSATGETAEHVWGLPVVREITLNNGVRFESTVASDAWRTVVADMPTNLAGGLQAGDVVVSYIPTAENITNHDSLLNVFNREMENGVEQFMFAVQRDGSMWVASLIYSGAEN